jgi:hypothetical protein
MRALARSCRSVALLPLPLLGMVGCNQVLGFQDGYPFPPDGGNDASEESDSGRDRNQPTDEASTDGLPDISVAADGATTSDVSIDTAGDVGDAMGSCSRDEDCDDKNPCNGVEKCQESTCVRGVDPCPNPDPVHCDRACTAMGNLAQCGPVRAADRDGDTHGSLGCGADPTGDDCDDSNPAVHPGAKELCNGIDDDCNGLTDLNDGLVARPSCGTISVGIFQCPGQRSSTCTG